MPVEEVRRAARVDLGVALPDRCEADLMDARGEGGRCVVSVGGGRWAVSGGRERALEAMAVRLRDIEATWLWCCEAVVAWLRGCEAVATHLVDRVPPES